MDFGNRHRTFMGWLDCLLVGLLLVFLYGLNKLLYKSKVTSKKSTDIELRWMVIDNPYSLNLLTICFFFFSISSFGILWKTPKPTSLDTNRYFPYSSHVWVGLTYKTPLTPILLHRHKTPWERRNLQFLIILTHGSAFWNSKVFLASILIAGSLSVIFTKYLAYLIKFVRSFVENEG